MACGAVTERVLFASRGCSQILGVHAFDATRKRMSMVVRASDGTTSLLIKGADNVMLERCCRSTPLAALNAHLTDFSKLGLRTLVLGQRHLSTMEADAWHVAYKVWPCRKRR